MHHAKLFFLVLLPVATVTSDGVVKISFHPHNSNASSQRISPCRAPGPACDAACRKTGVCASAHGVLTFRESAHCGRLFCREAGNAVACAADSGSCVPNIDVIGCDMTGVFPDLYDCHNVLHCTKGQLAVSTRMCERDYGYDACTGACDMVLPYQRCKPQTAYCKTYGQFGRIPSNDRLYYYCVHDYQRNLHPVIGKCSKGFFDIKTHSCTRSPQPGCLYSQETENNYNEDDESSDDSEKEIKMKGPGNNQTIPKIYLSADNEASSHVMGKDVSIKMAQNGTETDTSEDTTTLDVVTARGIDKARMQNTGRIGSSVDISAGAGTSTMREIESVPQTTMNHKVSDIKMIWTPSMVETRDTPIATVEGTSSSKLNEAKPEAYMTTDATSGVTMVWVPSTKETKDTSVENGEGKSPSTMRRIESETEITKIHVSDNETSWMSITERAKGKTVMGKGTLPSVENEAKSGSEKVLAEMISGIGKFWVSSTEETTISTIGEMSPDVDNTKFGNETTPAIPDIVTDWEYRTEEINGASVDLSEETSSHIMSDTESDTGRVKSKIVSDNETVWLPTTEEIKGSAVETVEGTLTNNDEVNETTPETEMSMTGDESGIGMTQVSSTEKTRVASVETGVATLELATKDESAIAGSAVSPISVSGTVSDTEGHRGMTMGLELGTSTVIDTETQSKVKEETLQTFNTKTYGESESDTSRKWKSQTTDSISHTVSDIQFTTPSALNTETYTTFSTPINVTSTGLENTTVTSLHTNMGTMFEIEMETDNMPFVSTGDTDINKTVTLMHTKKIKKIALVIPIQIGDVDSENEGDDNEWQGSGDWSGDETEFRRNKIEIDVIIESGNDAIISNDNYTGNEDDVWF